MDVVVPSICLSSLAGALFFYAGGRLNGGTAVPEEPRAIEPGVEEEREARTRAEQAASGAAKATREAVAALAEERARTTALREELAAERDARRRADAEAATERRRLLEEAVRQRGSAAGAADGRAQIEARAAALGAELEKAGREIARLRAEVEKSASAARRASGEAAVLRAKVAEQERALAERDAARAEIGAARAAAEKSVAEAASLREENATLREEVASLVREQAAAPDLGEVQRRTVTATMALRSLEQRSGEVSRREEEITDLRRRVEALAAAAAEAEVLRQQVRDLLAQGYARQPAHTLESEGAPGGGLSPELETGLEAGLRALRRAEPGCRIAVLSDERGLLVAAQGEEGHRLELAAAAALTTTAADRLRELLPIGEPASLTVVDVHATELRTRWLRWDDECFLLSTIGAARELSDAPAEALREELATLIGR